MIKKPEHIIKFEEELNNNSDLVIEINNLSKSFDGKVILKNVSLKIKRGENVVIVGKSGIGKSVLVKCLVGLIEPDDGEIKLFGKNISTLKGNELNLIRSKVGFLFQGSALYDSMSVRENLSFPLLRNPMMSNKESIDNLIYEVLEQVDLLEAIDKYPNELSGGMKKRIGLARTLIQKPDIILYDEPTTGLDPLTSKEISELILKVQSKNKASSIIITHDLKCAKLTSNRILILKDKSIYMEGKYDQLEKSIDPWVQSYFN